ncbi:MAG: hypothetical protein AB7F75_10125 [Planctomycetota bacterium]
MADEEGSTQEGYLTNLLKNSRFADDQDADGQPDYWVRVEDIPSNFRPYGRLQLKYHAPGDAILQLESNGTNVAVENHDSTLSKVDPHSSYHAEVQFKTENCLSCDARASLGILWIDAAGKVVGENWARLQNEDAEGRWGGEWKALSLDVNQIPESAVMARVRLGLMQDPQTVKGPAIQSRGMFRSVEFTRRPRVKITSDHEGLIFPNAPMHLLRFQIEGLDPGKYTCLWTVHDYTRRRVTGGEYAVEPPKDIRDHIREVEMNLGGRKGWYKLELVLRTQGPGSSIIARESMVFGVGPSVVESVSIPQCDQLGLDIQGNALEGSVSDLGDLIEDTRTHHVLLTLWNSQFDSRQPISKSIVGEMVGRLNEANVRVIAALGYIPTESQGEFVGSNMHSLFSANRRHWEGILGRTGKQFSEVDSWIVGAESDTSMAEQGTLAIPLLAEIRRILGIPGAKLGLPMARSFPGQLVYPRSFSEVDIFTFIQQAAALDPSSYLDMRQFSSLIPPAAGTAPGTPASVRQQKIVRLELMDDKKPFEERFDSMLFGIIHLLNRGADRVTVRLKDEVGRSLVDFQNRYRPEYFVFRTLTEIAAPLRIIGSIDLPEGSDNLILEFPDRPPGQKLAMLVWNHRRAVTEDVFLGDRLKILDLMGNKDPLPPVEGINKIPVGRIPSFLMDIDEGLMRTRLSVVLGKPQVDTRTKDVSQSVEVVNFLQENLSGSLSLSLPKGWTVVGEESYRIPTMKNGDRRIINFKIRPDPFETTEKSVPIVMDFSFDGKQRPPMRIFKRFQFSSRSIQMIVDSPSKVQDMNTVHITVKNTGGGQVDLMAYNATIGRKEDLQFLGLLKPGDARSVDFLVSRKDIESGNVTLGVRENGGSGRFINRRLAIQGGKIVDVD